MPARRLARLAGFHPDGTQSRISHELVAAGFTPHRRGQLRLAQTRQANGRQRRRHVEAQRFPVRPDAEPPEIIGIVVNEKGLERALATPGVTTIGYPYSISAYFRRANANMSRDESRAPRRKAKERHQPPQTATSSFTSPWPSAIPTTSLGAPKSSHEALEWLKDIRVRTVSLADTVGTADPELVGDLFREVKDHVAGIELGVHLHSRAENAEEKILAAYEAGCRRFDSALTGLGGCPFAGDNLVGNIATEQVLAALKKAGADPGIDTRAPQQDSGDDQRNPRHIRPRAARELND